MRIAKVVFLIVFSLMLTSDVFAARALKKTVAVFDFQNDSGYSSLGNLGEDFSTQLADALIKSGKFVVLTRQDLDVVMAEQDLAASDRFAKSRTAKKGKIIPAQILIKGRITEFEEQTSGGGQGFSIKGISIGANKASAHMAVIIQLVDSTTGEILDSERVEGQARAGGFSIGYSGTFSLGTSSFKKTPLGKAVQITIDNAVKVISDKLEDLPWKGRVSLVKEGTIYINSGKNTGVKKGATFAVYREGETIVDPETGMELGCETEGIAQIAVTSVQDKFSKAEIVGSASANIQTGDLVLEQ